MYAVNRLARRLNLVGVFVEGGKEVSKNLSSLNKLRRFYGSRIDALREDLMNAGKTRCYTKLMGNGWKRIHDGVVVIKVGVGKFEAKAIKKLKPDVLLVFGTSIVKEDVIKTAKICAINLHWGLSPYYRGSFCTEWAIYNEDVANIGVTIHYLDRGIDTGDVIAQKRPRLEPGDGVETINVKLSVEGVELMAQVVEYVERKGRPRPAKQNLSGGNLYYIKDFGPEIAHEVEKQIENGCIRKAMEDGQKEKLKPIVASISSSKWV